MENILYTAGAMAQMPPGYTYG